MKRREFIAWLTGAAATWPLAARAQPLDRVRRIALLLPASPTDVQFQARVGAFLQGLQQAGWVIGRNVELEYRWAENNPVDTRKHAAELVALAPDVILADGAGAVGSLLQITRTVPIVFPAAGDPVGAGFVETLARPGGNATGFMNFEYSISGKWLELLKQIAPDVTRVAVLRDPALPTGIGQFGVIQAAAASLRVDVVPVNVLAVSDIERGVSSLAQRPNGGLIMTANPTAIAHRSHIIELAKRYKLPAVYFEPVFARDGGLISYGPDIVDQYRRAAGYVDRILKGEKPADLPVQAPTKYQLVINLKTAKTLGLELHPQLLATADEVIE
jgi:putative ABC transport system substrate-binding protein